MDAATALELPGSEEALRTARTGLDAFASGQGLAPERVWQFQVALDEALSNIVRYGRRDGGPLRIELRLLLRDGLLEMVVEDDADPFDPLKAPPPDTKAPLHERRPGGLGIALVRELMDVVEYTRVGDRNRLRLGRRVL
jgi:serine/threonine-protein kinase RsbW